MTKLREFWRSRLPELFGVDLRSLALFRVGLATVTFFDLLVRLGDLRAFYTDFGVLPRHWLMEIGQTWRLSLHVANGETWFQFALITLQALLALMVLVGIRTRLATVLTFVLLLSLQNRNPLILTGADNLLMCLWFWALFLPTAARWSVDAALSPNAPPASHRHLSWASAGLLLQVLSVYFFSAILKSGADWWPDGTAVWYALSIDRYASPAGVWLREWAPMGVLTALTWYVYFLEWLGPLLALSPFFTRHLRAGVLGALVLMHLGFALFLEVGHFPYVCLAGLSALLGSGGWDWLGRRVTHGRFLKIYYDQDCGFCLKSCLLLRHLLILPRTDILPAQGSTRASALMQAQYSWVVIDGEDVAHTKWNAWVAIVRHSLLLGWAWRLMALPLWERPGNAVYDWVGRHRAAFGRVTGVLLPEREVRFEAGRMAQRIAAVFVIVLLLWNLGTVRAVPSAVTAALLPSIRLLRLDQVWGMFSPYPTRSDGWFIVPGKLQDGREIDVLRPGHPVAYAKPEAITRTHENRFRWRSYHKRIWLRQFANQRQYYARYLCRDWNITAPPGQRLLSLNIVYMLETTLPPGQTPTIEQRVLWRHQCLAEKERPELPDTTLLPGSDGNEPD